MMSRSKRVPWIRPRARALPSLAPALGPCPWGVGLLLAAATLSAATGSSVAAAQAPTLRIRALSLPDGGPSRSRIDTAQEAVAVRLGVAARRLRPEEERGLAETMEAAYGEMLAARGPFPSLLVASHEEPQRGRRFDALLAEPEGSPEMGVVFLHGSAGNFAWPCHLVASAAAEVGALTLCPSSGPAARWQAAEGRRIVEASIAYLEGRGIRRIVLAGLSSGAIGASALATPLATRLAGLLLLSGAAPGARTRLPALLIHGDHDTMVPPSRSRRFAEASPRSTHVALDGNHFVAAHRRVQVRALISGWLRWVQQGAPGPANGAQQGTQRGASSAHSG